MDGGNGSALTGTPSHQPSVLLADRQRHGLALGLTLDAETRVLTYRRLTHPTLAPLGQLPRDLVTATGREWKQSNGTSGSHTSSTVVEDKVQQQ